MGVRTHTCADLCAHVRTNSHKKVAQICTCAQIYFCASALIRFYKVCETFLLVRIVCDFCAHIPFFLTSHIIRTYDKNFIRTCKNLALVRTVRTKMAHGAHCAHKVAQTHMFVRTIAFVRLCANYIFVHKNNYY